MPSTTSSTKPVWIINKAKKEDWMKKHSSDTILKKKFEKFEKSVTGDPTNKNRDVLKLKPPLKDQYEYKKPPVRGLYTLDEGRAEILLVEFEYKGNVKYKRGR